MKTPRNNNKIDNGQLADLTARVRASYTYSQCYFVLMTKIRKNGDTWEMVDQLIMSDLINEEQATADKQRYESIRDLYGRVRGVKTTISVHNIFERYDLWKAGHGDDVPRAAQWESIKNTGIA